MLDKNIFLSQNLADKNSEIMDMFFTLNKILDNLMDYLDIEVAMSKLSAYIHKIAHVAPLDADRYRDYNAVYGYRTKYNTIQGQYKDFINPLEGIENVISYLVDITNALSDARALGKKEQNDDYVIFINSEIIKLRTYKQQFIFLYGKIQTSLEEGNTYQDIDLYIEQYIGEAV